MRMKNIYMGVTVTYMGVTVTIDELNKSILIHDDIKSNILFNMIFNSILKKIDIDLNGFSIIRNPI